MNFTNEQILVLFKNIEKHNSVKVHIKVIEELSELSQIISKQLVEYDIENRAKIIDEIADCYVVLEQMKILYGEDKIQERINFKVERLKNRLLI